MSLLFVGYFPKKIELATEAMGLPGVTEIWSVGNCISNGPPNWITRWLHNAAGAYDTRELALSLVPSGERESYTLLAYRVWHEEFGECGTQPCRLKDEMPALQLEPAYRVVGYDAVSASLGQFECSPLSCNGGAKYYKTNSRCLFATLAEALTAAAEFARGGWEPGPYRVVEVLAPPTSESGSPREPNDEKTGVPNSQLDPTRALR